jgi:hypothetical protein
MRALFFAAPRKEEEVGSEPVEETTKTMKRTITEEVDL